MIYSGGLWNGGLQAEEMYSLSRMLAQSGRLPGLSVLPENEVKGVWCLVTKEISRQVICNMQHQQWIVGGSH